MPSWLLLQSGRVRKMTVKDPILVHTLKATLKRWPAETLLLEFKAFLIHKHELFACKGSLLGKSYCYSRRRLLSHGNCVVCGTGSNCVSEDVSHAFWLVARKWCQHKTPHTGMHCLPSSVLLPAESPSTPRAMPKKQQSRACLGFWGPFLTENELLKGVGSYSECSVGFHPPSKHPSPQSLLPAEDDLWLLLTRPNSTTSLLADEFKDLIRAASLELSHCAMLSPSKESRWTLLQAAKEILERFTPATFLITQC